MQRDYYHTLGVGREATAEEIRQAFRRLARRYHPDVNPGDAGAEARFKEINAAYQALLAPGRSPARPAGGFDWLGWASRTLD